MFQLLSDLIKIYTCFNAIDVKSLIKKIHKYGKNTRINCSCILPVSVCG